MSALTQPQLTRDYLLSLSSSGFEPAVLVDCLSDLEAYASTLESSSADTTELLADYYCLYFFSLFLDDDLNEARFLVQRIPASPAAHLSVAHAQSLLRALYTISPETFYSQGNNYTWSSIVTPLKDRFLEHHRRQSFTTFAHAYTSISPKHVATFLGISDDKIEGMIQELVKEGWKLDPATGLLQPDSGKAGKQSLETGKDHRIQRLTALVTHLTGS